MSLLRLLRSVLRIAFCNGHSFCVVVGCLSSRALCHFTFSLRSRVRTVCCGSLLHVVRQSVCYRCRRLCSGFGCRSGGSSVVVRVGRFRARPSHGGREGAMQSSSSERSSFTQHARVLIFCDRASLTFPNTHCCFASLRHLCGWI